MVRASPRALTFALCGFGLGILSLASGCGGSTSGSIADGGGASSEASSGDEATPDEGGGVDAGGESSSPEEAGTAPRNAACTPTTQQTGTIANTKHGRLDGTLVYVLPVSGSQACNGDSSHVHLQIEVSSLVYDVAVDIGTSSTDEVGMLEESMTVPGGTWSEGWHGSDALTYTALGIHSTQITLTDPDTVAGKIEAALESTSKIAVFCTSYSQGNGCHDVHYENGNGEDGALVLDPTSASSPMLFFRFTSDSF